MDNDNKPTKKEDPQNIEIKKLELWGKVIEHISPTINYFQARLEKHDAPIKKTTIRGIMIIIGLIILTCAALVFLDKMDDSAFTFVIGAVVGFLISIAKNFLGNSE